MSSSTEMIDVAGADTPEALERVSREIDRALLVPLRALTEELGRLLGEEELNAPFILELCRKNLNIQEGEDSSRLEGIVEDLVQQSRAQIAQRTESISAATL